MSQITKQCLLETWQPEPKKSLVGEIPVQEGKTLPNSITEDIGGFSLTPAYSIKQLRCIGKKHGKKGITRKARNQWMMVATW